MKYKTEEYIVSFIDVLGAKEKIINECNSSLNLIHEVYEKAMQLYKTSNRKLSENLYDDSEQINIRIFSDNIVLYTRTNNDVTGSFLHLISLTAYVQGVFLEKGFLVRGGISLGDFFADDIMIWGTALVKSYYIENSISIFPRIVIDNNLISFIGDRYLNNNDFINQDNDGYYYVNYLTESLFNNFDSIANKAKSMCEYELRKAHYGENNENMKIVQKIMWQNKYIKHCIKNSKSEFGEIDV